MKVAAEQITPPGVIASHLAPFKEAPATRGGFFVAEREGGELLPRVQFETFLDDVTGMPLPLAPIAPEGLSRGKNYHHHFHPENSPLLQGIAGQALRHCRIQYVRRDIHDNYHKWFGGPFLPETEAEIFKTAVLAAAGVVPRRALDMSSGDGFKIITLKDRDYQAIANQSVMHPDQAKIVGRFFAHYVTQQGWEGKITSSQIREFLDEDTSPERKFELARKVFLAPGIESSLEELRPEYQALCQEGLVAQKRQETIYTVVRRFIRRYAFRDFSTALTERFGTI